MTSISRRQRRKSTRTTTTDNIMTDIVSPIASSTAQRKNNTKEPQITFPYKLFEMLEYAGDSEFSSACYWAEDGSAFVIQSKTVMMRELVPKFFNQTKYRSFTRQLNLWGFLRSGKTWTHEQGLFHREKAHLLNQMGRVAIKSKVPSSFIIPSSFHAQYSTPVHSCDNVGSNTNVQLSHPAAAVPVTVGKVFDYFTPDTNLSHEEAVDLAADFSLSAVSDETATTQEDDVKSHFDDGVQIETCNTDTSACTTDDLLCLASIFEQKEEGKDENDPSALA